MLLTICRGDREKTTVESISKDTMSYRLNGIGKSEYWQDKPAQEPGGIMPVPKRKMMMMPKTRQLKL